MTDSANILFCWAKLLDGFMVLLQYTGFALLHTTCQVSENDDANVGLFLWEIKNQPLLLSSFAFLEYIFIITAKNM